MRSWVDLRPLRLALAGWGKVSFARVWRGAALAAP